MTRTDLGVLPGHPDAGVEAGSVVRLHDVPPEHAARAHAAVVRTLGQSEVGILVTRPHISQSQLTWGPGNPLAGQPRGRPVSADSKVYSWILIMSNQ